MDTHVSVMESSTNGINWNINIITNMLLEIIQGQGGGLQPLLQVYPKVCHN